MTPEAQAVAYRHCPHCGTVAPVAVPIEVDLFWFAEAAKLAKESVRFEDRLHRMTGLYYGACAARTEHARALGLAYQKIARLQARLERAVFPISGECDPPKISPDIAAGMCSSLPGNPEVSDAS